MPAEPAVILAVWWLDRFGGMERHVTELACALRRAGHRVLVVSQMPLRRPNPYARQLREAGIPLHCPPAALWIASSLRLALTAPDRPTLLDQWMLRTLARECAALPAPLLHVHGCRLAQAWLLPWARERRIPTVYTEHVTISELGGAFTAAAPRHALAAGALLTVSEHARRDLLALLPAPRPVALTGHIVSTPAPAAASPTAPPYLLCPARLTAHKGIDVLLRAFAALAPRHPQLRLILAGTGDRSRELKALARALALGRSVEFAGHLPPAALAERMARATAVVLPSRSEGLPLALLEAMAHGRAIVASAIGGIPEMIQDGATGLLVAPDHPDALARALERLLTDSALRDRLGAAARTAFLATPHHESSVLSTTLDLYRQVCAEFPADAAKNEASS